MTEGMGVEDAARYLGIKPSTVYELAQAGRIVHYRPTGPRGRITFYQEDLERYRRSVRIGAPEDYIRLQEVWK